ncbi:hypothetical protein B0675_02380 [Streptomyces sp. M41(2017)]|uniref:putative phage holin n=1 Tax=Streptomyces sp. M41(2017) TaxID=1955065 RepID=UPI0009BEEC4A|nr:hypothetical protein [Streptomyces sp. M41(2017)]OQQ16150.1 hypothetical protein B0675_02380 [Streptomyces sp. M41(2017)]
MTLAEVMNASVSGLVAVFAATFLTTYTRRARWEDTSIGRYFVAAVATVGLLALYTVVIMLVGLDGTAATVLRVCRSVLLLGIAGLLLQATRAVRKAYPRRRKR